MSHSIIGRIHNKAKESFMQQTERHNDECFSLTKFKAFSDDKLKVANKMNISEIDRVENIVRKGENSGHKHVFYFSHRIFKMLPFQGC